MLNSFQEIPSRPVNCAKCGRVLFKFETDKDFAKYLLAGNGDRGIVVKCKCGALQKVMIVMLPEIKVETIKSSPVDN